MVIVSFSIFEVLYVDFYVKSQGSDPNGKNLDLNLLRLLRIFRVVRVFNKLEDLHRILTAVKASVSPVLSAFLLFAVVLSIYAIVACNLFLNNPDPELQDRITLYYGSFSRAFVSLLGVATGFDSWTNEVRFLGGGDLDASGLAFYISFIMIVTIVTVNVIVAVLLEGFISSIHAAEERKLVTRDQQRQNKQAGALDPLLATLANFNSSQHLLAQLELIFVLWDVDDGGKMFRTVRAFKFDVKCFWIADLRDGTSGSVDYDEMRSGLRKLGRIEYMPGGAQIRATAC